MSKLIVQVDHIKLAQWIKSAKDLISKAEHLLDEAAMDRKDKKQIYCSDFDCLERECDDETVVE